MSILLNKYNWLVADWVMRFFFKDCSTIFSQTSKYEEVKLDIEKSILQYTFLLNYPNPKDRNKIIQLKELVDKIVVLDKNRRLKEDWDREGFQVYSQRIKHLQKLITDDLELYQS